MKTFETVELTSDMKTFLKGDSPKDEHFTSIEEIHLIEDNLNITNYGTNIVALRNSVVQFYDELIGDGSDREQTHRFMESMMSVTSVIDNYAYKILILGL